MEHKLSSSRAVTLPAVIGFVAIFAAAMAMSLWTSVRTGPPTLLLILLVGGLLVVPIRRMIPFGVATLVLRTSLTALQMWRLTGGISGRDLLEDGIHGVIVYAVMGAAIYIFRRGREEMMARVAELRTLETIGQLAADLAHDFNNTLQVVTGTAQLLTRNASLDRAAARDVRNILSAGEQGMALTREMMNLVRPPSPDPVACDLSQTVDQQMKLLHRVLPTTIQLVREYAAEPLPVRLSAGMSYRILVNLCLNARSAMSGGGLLTLRTSRRQVGRRDFAVLEVVDTGTGIDPRLVRSALSAFPLPWRKTSAVGLGIRIVRSITELHGGHVSFHGEPGKGTTVTVCFPLQPMDAQSVAAAEEPAFAGEAR